MITALSQLTANGTHERRCFWIRFQSARTLLTIRDINSLFSLSTSAFVLEILFTWRFQRHKHISFVSICSCGHLLVVRHNCIALCALPTKLYYKKKKTFLAHFKLGAGKYDRYCASDVAREMVRGSTPPPFVIFTFCMSIHTRRNIHKGWLDPHHINPKKMCAACTTGARLD